MAIYPALFGHVELPDVPPPRRDRHGIKLIGVRLVRPVDPYHEHTRESSRSRP